MNTPLPNQIIREITPFTLRNAIRLNSLIPSTTIPSLN